MATARTTNNRRVEILGIPVDRLSRLEFRLFLRRALTSGCAHRIVTLNPEIALAARRNPRYGAVVRTADCITLDGVGAALALRLRGEPAGERITGTDILHDLATIAVEDERTVAFLLREGGLTTATLLRNAMGARWPALKLAVGSLDPTHPMSTALAQSIADAAPSILIVNFGHPIQERWLAEHLDRFPSVRIAVGVGGALDYLTGAVPVPPLLARRLGVEWAWRLIRQPWRARRIARATITFPFAVVRDALKV